MKNIFLAIFNKIIYFFTPFGWIIDILYLRKKIPEDIEISSPHTYIYYIGFKKKPTIGERISWFFNGLFLFIETYLIIIFTDKGVSNLTLNQFLGFLYAIYASQMGIIILASSVFINSLNKSFGEQKTLFQRLPFYIAPICLIIYLIILFIYI